MRKTLTQIASEKELALLMSYKPENVDLDVIHASLIERGYSTTLALYGQIVDNELYNEVQSREAISWLIEYIGWHIKTKLFCKPLKPDWIVTDRELCLHYGQIYENVKHMKYFLQDMRERYQYEMQNEETLQEQ